MELNKRQRGRLLTGMIFAALLTRPEPASCGQNDLGGLKPENWVFLDGAEFPGVQGELAVGKDDHEAAALLIRGDFTKGGNFVGAGRSFPSPLDVTSLTVRVNSSTGVLGLRVNDSSGQCFQQSVKFPANTWQEITLTEFGNPKRKDIHHWGGARDGVFRRPATGLAFLLFKPVDDASKTGEVRIAGIKADIVPAKPPVKPATITPTTLTQFWLTPDQTNTLHWRYAPGTGASMPTVLPFTLRDYAGATVNTQTLAVARDGSATATVTLPVGYYDAEIEGNRFGIICQPPCETNTTDDFFAIDGALSSLNPFRQESVRTQVIANLARCGVTMVRERADWSRNNPASGVWISNRCDIVRRQLKQGRVAVLECFQDAPTWAGSSVADPYPNNLIDTRDAWTQLAKRWGGAWGALEVWNEPNLRPYPADWWSAMQKAVAYGMREALPNLLCGGGALSTFDQPFTSQLARNRVLDTMDFVSFHTYSPAPGIEAMVANYREWLAAAGHAGLPLWLTEVGHPWTRGPTRPPLDQDTSSALDMTMQVIEARACGIDRVFPFIYGYYDENQNNFGMMGRENTPLRSLAGYANLVRILSHRTFVGDLAGVEGVIRARAFVGEKNDLVLVVLYTGVSKANASVDAKLPGVRIEGVDGRRLEATADGRIPVADGLVYVWVPRSAIAARLRTDTDTVRLYRMSQQPTPERKPVSPLVLRCVNNPELMRVSARGYDVPDPFDGHYTANVRLFNLSTQMCRANVRASLAGTNAELRQEAVEIPARASIDLSWTLDLSGSSLVAEGVADLLFDAVAADGAGDRLAMRLMRPVGIDVMLAHRDLRLDTPVREVQRWSANIVEGGTMQFAPLAEGGVRVEVDFGSAAGGSAWAYPKFFGLPPADTMRGVKGVVVRGRVEGGGTVRMFAVEKNGGGKYIYASPVFPADGQWHNAFVSLQDFSPFASVDPNGRLDPDQLAHVEIGCNSRAARCVIEINQLWFVGDETREGGK